MNIKQYFKVKQKYLVKGYEKALKIFEDKIGKMEKSNQREFQSIRYMHQRQIKEIHKLHEKEIKLKTKTTSNINDRLIDRESLINSKISELQYLINLAKQEDKIRAELGDTVLKEASKLRVHSGKFSAIEDKANSLIKLVR